MIKNELYSIRKDNIKLYKTYSSDGFKIKQLETGKIYDEAIDVEDAPFTYEETNEKIEEEPEETEEIE